MEKYKEFSSVVKTTRTIEIEEIEGTNLVYYRDCSHSEREDGSEKVTRASYGVTLKDNLEKVQGMRPITEKVSAPRMHEGYAYVRFISDEDFALMKQGELPFYDAVTDVPKPGPDVPAGRLVLWNESSYELADLDQKFISVPIAFDYSKGSITNVDYDLAELLKKLKEDQYVLGRENLSIDYIPFHAREEDEGMTKQIRFSYLLPDEEYDKLKNKGLDTYQRRQYILDHYIGAKECINLEPYNYEDYR